MYLATVLALIAAAAALPSPAELGTSQSPQYYTLFAVKGNETGNGTPLYTIKNGSNPENPEVFFVTRHRYADHSAQVLWQPTTAGPSLALDHGSTSVPITAFEELAVPGRKHPVRAIPGSDFQTGWYEDADGNILNHSSGKNNHLLCKKKINHHTEQMLFCGMGKDNKHAPKNCEFARLRLVKK